MGLDPKEKCHYKSSSRGSCHSHEFGLSLLKCHLIYRN